MAIVISNVRERDEDRLHVEIVLDGVPWRVGDVPVELDCDEAAILAHLEAREGDLWADMQRKAYPLAVVNIAEGETRREAWERVLAAGVDDAGVSLGTVV